MIDSVDRKILKVLETNSKASFSEVGRQIFLSPSSVRERIKKLEDLGVIKGYGLHLNQALLGNSIEVFILLKVFTGKLQYAIKELKSYAEIQEIHRITGHQNFHMRVALKDQLHLQQFIDRLITFGEPTTHLILSELATEKQQREVVEVDMNS